MQLLRTTLALALGLTLARPATSQATCNFALVLPRIAASSARCMAAVALVAGKKKVSNQMWCGCMRTIKNPSFLDCAAKPGDKATIKGFWTSCTKGAANAAKPVSCKVGQPGCFMGKAYKSKDACTKQVGGTDVWHGVVQADAKCHVYAFDDDKKLNDFVGAECRADGNLAMQSECDPSCKTCKKKNQILRTGGFCNNVNGAYVRFSGKCRSKNVGTSAKCRFGSPGCFLERLHKTLSGCKAGSGSQIWQGLVSFDGKCHTQNGGYYTGECNADGSLAIQYECTADCSKCRKDTRSKTTLKTDGSCSPIEGVFATFQGVCPKPKMKPLKCRLGEPGCYLLTAYANGLSCSRGVSQVFSSYTKTDGRCHVVNGTYYKATCTRSNLNIQSECTSDCSRCRKHYSRATKADGSCNRMDNFFATFHGVCHTPKMSWTKIFQQSRCRKVFDGGASAFNQGFGKGSVVRYDSSAAGAPKPYAYYLRLTPMPSGTTIRGLLLDTWSIKSGNIMNVDFRLYSTADDLETNSNPWAFCNGDDKGVGFPRDCGPKHKTDGRWMSSNSRRQCGVPNVVLYAGHIHASNGH